jgi:hypothetical protein
MKNTMNYEAPVAEMIELQASMVLMNSGGGGGGNNSGDGTGGGGTQWSPGDL